MTASGQVCLLSNTASCSPTALLLCTPDVGAAASAADSPVAAAAPPLPLLMSTRLSVLPLPLLLVACELKRRQLLDPALPTDVSHLLLLFSKPEMNSAVLLRSIRPSSACLRQFNCAITVAF
jgi:hypothetical protein